MRISPIQQAQNKTTRPSFQRLKGVKFVKNTVFEDGKNFVLKSNKFFDKKKLTKLIKEDCQLKEFFKKFNGWVVFSEDVRDVSYRKLNDDSKPALTCRREGTMTILYEDASLKGAFRRKIKNLFKPVAKKDLLAIHFCKIDDKLYEMGDNRQNPTDWYSKLVKERDGVNCIQNPLWFRHELAVRHHYDVIEQEKNRKIARITEEKARIIEEKRRERDFELDSSVASWKSNSKRSPYNDVINSGPW